MEKDIINKLDPRKESVVCYQFKKALDKHHNDHFEEKTQTSSVFDKMDIDTVIGVQNTRENLMTLSDKQIPVYEVKYIPVPDLSIFEKSVADKSYLQDLDITDPAQAQLYDKFRFYFPALIWVYNTLKLLLLEDDAAIKLLDLRSAEKGHGDGYV